jgi:2-oxoglutarate dehydrogenase E2 component (dihydrolipoamide succinyltransferase)
MKDLTRVSLPKLGESILSATVVRWFKKVGDPVALDESLLEVATDKVNSEIPSPVAGILQEILAHVDQEIAVGAPLALIATGEAVPVPLPPAESSDFLSPSVVRLLREKGIPLSDIDHIPHTGQGGRLTKKDVEDYVPRPQCSMGVERVKMSPLRKAIADNMVKSFYEAPHASLITEVDVTDALKWIHDHRQKTGEKITITAIAARSISCTLRDFPLLNASLEGDTIVMKKNVNLGIAVSVDQGVMVPVVKQCQEKTLSEIGHEIANLADKTRSHSLAPDDTRGGTITLTNFGMTGVMIGVPIIRYPEVAIVGLGAITKKVAVLPDGSTGVRSMMFISLTFDHRVLDGIYGCGFLNGLKKDIERTNC